VGEGVHVLGIRSVVRVFNLTFTCSYEQHAEIPGIRVSYLQTMGTSFL
jgi:hypothetical protein